MPGQASTRTRPTGTERRGQILNATAELMGRRGFEGTTVDDIGKAVGITAAALYRHFRNKQALVEEVILGMLSELVATIEEASGPEQTVSDVQAVFVGFVLDHPHHVATYLREQTRLDGDAGVRQTELEESFFAAQGLALALATGAERHDIHGPLMRLRIAASFGAARAHVFANGQMRRPALDRYLAEGLVPVASVPLEAASPPPAEEAPAGLSVDSPRKRILENALPLFRERGFGGVSVAEVGEAAGIAGPNIYRYFDSKVDILVDVFDRVGERVMIGMDRAIQEADDADEALSAIVRSYVDAAYDNVDLIVVMDQERALLPQSERPRLRRRATRFSEAWRSVVAQCRPGLSTVEVDTLVRAATSMVNTCCRQRPVATAQNVAILTEAFLRGNVSPEHEPGVPDANRPT